MPGLKSYDEWLMICHRNFLPNDTPAPPGYETYNEWFRRVRGIDPMTGESLAEIAKQRRYPLPRESPVEAARAKPPIPEAPGRTPSGPSGYFRQALSAASKIATRLGKLGQGTRNVLPVAGAVSGVIHAIRESQELQRATTNTRPELRAELPSLRPVPGAASHANSMTG